MPVSSFDLVGKSQARSQSISLLLYENAETPAVPLDDDQDSAPPMTPKMR